MAKTKKIPYTQDELKAMFEYRDGALFWRAARRNVAINKESGSSAHLQGYRIISIKNANYYAHRLIWKMFNNEEHGFIDHIDQDPSNNKIENLRLISQSQNLHNTGNPKNNTSGVKGVSWNKKCNKWCAYIMIDNKTTYLGLHIDFNKACQARKKAELKYFPEIYKTYQANTN